MTPLYNKERGPYEQRQKQTRGNQKFKQAT